MAGCSPLNGIDWTQIPVDHILKNMTPMTDTLNGPFGQFASLYLKYGSDPTEQAKLFDNWYVLKEQHLHRTEDLGEFDPRGYLENTAKNIAKPLKPFIRFYLLKAGQELKAHVDFATKSCMNFVYQKRFSSIVVDKVAYPYGSFLLDNTKMHGVPACDTDRFIVSFSFQESYDEVRRKCGILKRSSTKI